jgi:hypothetical protein
MIYYFDSHKRNPDVALEPVVAEGKAILFTFVSTEDYLMYMNRLHHGDYQKEQFEINQIISN